MMLETSVLPNVVEVSGTNSRLRTEIESIMGERHIAYYDQVTLTEVSEALGASLKFEIYPLCFRSCLSY